MSYLVNARVTCTNGERTLDGNGKVDGAVVIIGCLEASLLIVSCIWSMDDYSCHNRVDL